MITLHVLWGDLDMNFGCAGSRLGSFAEWQADVITVRTSPVQSFFKGDGHARDFVPGVGWSGKTCHC